MKHWEQLGEEHRRRNWARLRAGVFLALLAWALYFIVLPLLRHP